MLVPLVMSYGTIEVKNFWNAIYVYFNRPHLVNRKLVSISHVYLYSVEYNSASNRLRDVINYASLMDETSKVETLSKENLSNLVDNMLRPYDKDCKLTEVSFEEMKESLSGVFISLRILYPSNAKSNNCVEIALFDKNKSTATFLAATSKDKFTLVAPPFPYTFEHDRSGHLKLVIHLDEASTPSAGWLDNKVFNKILKWAEEYDESKDPQESLCLISTELYCSKYRELKEKYGQRMVAMWQENTDPLKFVYEDVAIATYLICLWHKIDAESKPSFVDLGCGNGLLVYILNQEGFPGSGIDVRKRKIWDQYPEQVQLEVKTIIPSESSLFPEADWIIGNHSDELTPWIPVIAARSSRSTNFFVLPCCCYQFNGRKYIRKNTGVSQYNEYLGYVEEVSKTCGFVVGVDKLRIPSTKRTCIVSFKRNEEQDYDEIDADISKLIDQSGGGGCWVKDFQAREKVERVRNCTQVDRTIVTRLVNLVAGVLLKYKNHSFKRDGKVWNAGIQMPISDLAEKLDPNDLKLLKKECGGLQTLMKNHRYIFDVRHGGVRVREPMLYKDVQKYKEKPCWFFRNHPHGCLHYDECAYKH
ncbi:PREDICTED: probable tRNA (uracil-O(2)-)-methyltransferase [Nicrophorus vespilloides]|uniref:tRNA (uracil-O(2)-)-methyltransferase n=1 Tax=Nicrophorus vespilloides TaxID=110193 RepID=A0ABM1MIK2_NICVS|nr:PREDICTED: probable tRNA (uracil-O(2)-)-methyltransferase [Nicrophorus vespilloides]